MPYTRLKIPGENEVRMPDFGIINRPLITEKGNLLQSEGKYVFIVSGRANKHQVKEAVEGLFNVSVLEVNMINVKGKAKRMGPRKVSAPDRKKAIVTLKPGDKIEIFEGV